MDELLDFIEIAENFYQSVETDRFSDEPHNHGISNLLTSSYRLPDTFTSSHQVQKEIHDLDIDNYYGNSSKGCMLEVDLKYPNTIRDLHNGYPLSPESITIKSDLTSPFSRDVANKLQLKISKSQKLTPNLNDKTNYVLHIRNLKLYLSLGIELTLIHRSIVFDQSKWLKEPIDFNTEKRKNAQNAFEKDFYKLRNNSVFGKTLENLRNRKNVELVQTEKRMKKLIASPSFHSFKIFNQDLVGVYSLIKTLKLNRPIFTGAVILGLSKHLMYNFHYNFAKKQFGSRISLLFTDTESLCYEIECDDFYKDMSEHLEYFDTSEYPVNQISFDLTNKKVVGKIKDEMSSIVNKEFIGFKAKMYSIETEKYIKKKR